MRSCELVSRLEQCCGCGACSVSCPKQAITMCENEEGFLYPQIDESLCVDCGKCLQVCNFKKPQLRKSDKKTYAAFAGDMDLSKSASGGLFASLAQAVLDADGVVFGCTMVYEKEKLVVKHICVHDKDELIKIKGSKYIQSDTACVFDEVKENLLNKKDVLFSGTPCQVAGLKGYLQKDYENLYTVEVVCHGVPSNKLFHDYIAYVEDKEEQKIVDFKFRDKTQGWKLYGKMVLRNETGEQIERYFEPEESSYYQMFLNSYTYRDSCYDCPYASDNRQADVTIGDYWCVDLVHPELMVEHGGMLDEAKGVSCLVVNSKQGKKLMEMFGKGISKWESTYEKASRYNAQLVRPSVLKEERKQVFQLYKQGYGQLEKWYQKRLSKIKFKRKIRMMVPKSLKRLVRNTLFRNR